MITIVDYGSGNLRSVQKSFERLGSSVLVTSDPDRVAEADKLVLPGVGSFGDAMEALRARELVGPIKDHIRADRPFLGICIGLQLLFETGWEGGRNIGLGVLPGEVKRFDVPIGTKVPHMGWNTVSWHGHEGLIPQLKCDAEGWFYFVHSYVAHPSDESVIAAMSDYQGPFCSAVSQGRLLATQFHPEKSQSIGMRFLELFLGMV
ncbi:MAG: imidazole glycerol phosphate synthase subunit HisH [Pirellulales bacterium]